MSQFTRFIAVLLLSAGLMCGAFAQAISGKGFLPDENGTNLDDPQASKTAQHKVAPGTIIKDCAECPEMVVLPSGSFLMGADPFNKIARENESPQHRVQIQSFAIGKYEVTQEQWYAVMGNNPSYNKGLTLPVESMSWYSVHHFIVELNGKTGQKYRLPSEAEWEYAARAGTTTEWSFGNDESKLDQFAWHKKNSGDKTHEVGQKLPNQFGLFDTLGNVWEWTQDCWHDNYAEAPTDGSPWVTDCLEDRRVLRGGSWGSTQGVRPAYRFWQELQGRPNDLNIIYGFRLARDL